MQRVAVELQPRQQHGAEQAEAGEHGNDRHAGAQQGGLGTVGPGEADLGGLAAWPQQGKAGGQEGQRADECHQHAGAGDQAQLGHAAKAGGHEGKKAGGGGDGGQDNLWTNRQHGVGQRQGGVAGVQALLAVAHAELDGEVDRDADKQHRKRNRDQVQRPDRQRGKAGGEQQAEHQGGENGQDQAPGAHRQDQPEQHQGGADHHAGDSALGHRGEFLVGQGDRAGDANGGAARLHRGDLCGGLAQDGGGGTAGLQRAEVELGLCQHQAARAGEVNELASQQALPGQRRRRAGGGIGQRALETLHGGTKALERCFAAVHAHGDQGQRGEQAARGGIGGELAKERLGVDGAVEQLGKIGFVEEQQGVAGEPGRGVRPAGKAEVCGVGRQGGGEAGRGFLGFLRRGALDHGDQKVTELGESLGKGDFALAPGQGGVEKGIGVGGHAKAQDGQCRAEHGQDQAGQHHMSGPQAAEFRGRGEQMR